MASKITIYFDRQANPSWEEAEEFEDRVGEAVEEILATKIDKSSDLFGLYINGVCFVVDEEDD